METIDLTRKDDAPAPVVTDLTQDSDDEPPAKRAKALPRSLRLRTHPDQLPALWRDVASEGLSLPVIPFYGHTHGAHKCFSNFFASPFDFTLPACCSAAPRTLRVAFGEQAIMACKAAAMGDWASYDAISRSNTSPKACKALGRKVKPFRQDVWAGVVVEVAVEIAMQKFASDGVLWKVLDATGDRVLAEMTKNDSYWGTGIDRSHADAQTPSAWRGTNILGYALMVARERLRAQRAGSAAAPASSAPASSAPPPDDDDDDEDDEAPPPTPSRKRKAADASLTVVDGDVLTATEQWLLHQTNATKDATLASEADIDWSRTARSKMMASQVFDKYKHALVRAEINFATRRLLVGYSLVDSHRP
jgi:ribA/ribD-fused uncharacterized protein